jgi:hypothetical protein
LFKGFIILVHLLSSPTLKYIIFTNTSIILFNE